jgi:hypothetical protein
MIRRKKEEGRRKKGRREEGRRKRYIGGFIIDDL